MSEAQMRRISYLRSIVKDRDAEIERLRAALLQLARYSAVEEEMNWADTVLEMNAIARAALEGK